MCKFRSADAPQKGFISAGRSLLMGSVYGDESVSHRELRTVVIPRMRIDRVTKAATSDPTIMRVGAVLLHKLGPRRALDISSSMRTLARLQIRLRQHGVVGLGDYITGSDFDKVTEAVEVEGGLYMHDSGRQLFRSPAYVLKAGNGLLRCAQMKRV